ncbi:hypothetical protein AK812_SmicGene39423 [Symbiodinium microadriaticum]|uniref:C2H2-type domain-containing protein n=1 Tax=Symbiodinium microadriaticum TaxID=2951 RepID=A0A1Q9CBA2_SYMMI|nr:hypothetical protein AK812_SmicGene39423 [Symbiodinium microadriaticum]
MEADAGSAAGEVGSPSQPSGPPLETEQGPRLPHAGFQRPIYQLPHDYPQLLERMACTALRELCFYYLAQHLHLRYPDRRSSQARYLAQRRARGHQDPGDVYSYIFVQLEEPRDRQLDEDYRALAGLLDRGIPENDLGWITRIGGSTDPPRHVFLQQLAMLLRRSLRRHLQPSSADHVSAHMVEVAREMDLFYIPTILSLYPLLDATGTRDFQQWFYGYSGQDLMQDERRETSPIRAGILILIDKTLYTSVQVEDPLQHLMHRTQQRIANCRQNGMSQLQPPAVHQWWQQVEEGLRAAAHDPMQRQHCVPLRAPARLVALTANVAPRACPHCGIYFTSVRTMRIHVALKHHDLITRTPVTPRSYATMRMEYMCHSVDGLPTCRHCQWDFSSWASFCLHFEKERCSVLHRNSQVRHLNPITRILSRVITRTQLHYNRPFSMEPNHDVIRESAEEVASQELMSAREQANLLSSMMNKDRHPSAPPSSTDAANPSEASTAPHTPVRETRAPREAPVPMETRETKRQADLTEQELQDNTGGNGNGKGGDKWPRSQSKGNSRTSDGGWGRDHRAPQRRYRQWDWDKDKEDKTFDRATDRKLYELCLAMSRLIMRHEDQLSINRAQDNFVMFAQTQGVLSAVPELLKATEAWRQMKKEQPEIITLPLRTWLLKHWVDLMLQRMEAVMQSEDTIRQAKEMLILDESCNVPYLEWNPSERKLRIKKDRDPMTLSQVLELLKQMQILILQPLAVLRFHTTRELVQNMQSEVVPLMLQIGSRTAECHQLWNAFYRLSHSGACRVVATSLRGDRMGRSALALAIQRMIEDM